MNPWLLFLILGVVYTYPGVFLAGFITCDQTGGVIDYQEVIFFSAFWPIVIIPPLVFWICDR